jgi:hypothetical protein
MKNKINNTILKKLLVGAILILSLSSISAFCVVRGYILDRDSEAVDATKINIVCDRAEGKLLSQIENKSGYLYPFGDWYDDCTYCDQGIYVSAFGDNQKAYYYAEPDFGPLAKEQNVMPKSNESPQTKVPGIRPEEPKDYTPLYLNLAIILAIIIVIVLIRKYGK